MEESLNRPDQQTREDEILQRKFESFLDCETSKIVHVSYDFSALDPSFMDISFETNFYVEKFNFLSINFELDFEEVWGKLNSDWILFEGENSPDDPFSDLSFVINFLLGNKCKY